MSIFRSHEISEKSRARVDGYVTLDPEEQLLFLYDRSLWSRGKAGLLVTTTRVVNFNGDSYQSYWYADMLSASFDPAKDRLTIATADGRYAFEVISAGRGKLSAMLAQITRGAEPGIERIDGEEPEGEAPAADLTALTPTGQYRVGERDVSCSHCQHELFGERRAQLNSAGMTLLNLDWLNTTASVLECRACGQLMWFIHVQRRP
jgi:hypothetical protein